MIVHLRYRLVKPMIKNCLLHGYKINKDLGREMKIHFYVYFPQKILNYNKCHINNHQGYKPWGERYTVLSAIELRSR